MSVTDVPVLAIDDLVIDIGGNRIVDHVSLSLGSGRILAIVGESGCGKSLTALSVLGLLPKAARITGGEIRLNGRDLLPLVKPRCLMSGATRPRSSSRSRSPRSTR